MDADGSNGNGSGCGNARLKQRAARPRPREANASPRSIALPFYAPSNEDPIYQHPSVQRRRARDLGAARDSRVRAPVSYGMPAPPGGSGSFQNGVSQTPVNGPSSGVALALRNQQVLEGGAGVQTAALAARCPSAASVLATYMMAGIDNVADGEFGKNGSAPAADGFGGSLAQARNEARRMIEEREEQLARGAMPGNGTDNRDVKEPAGVFLQAGSSHWPCPPQPQRGGW
jgi:hypothetical protein